MKADACVLDHTLAATKPLPLSTADMFTHSKVLGKPLTRNKQPIPGKGENMFRIEVFHPKAIFFFDCIVFARGSPDICPEVHTRFPVNAKNTHTHTYIVAVYASTGLIIKLAALRVSYYTEIQRNKPGEG